MYLNLLTKQTGNCIHIRHKNTLNHKEIQYKISSRPSKIQNVDQQRTTGAAIIADAEAQIPGAHAERISAETEGRGGEKTSCETVLQIHCCREQKTLS